MSLLDLPDDILYLIAADLSNEIRYKVYKLKQDCRTLASFRATCQRAFNLCEPLWCKFVSIKCVTQCDKTRLFLRTHTYRRKLVESLQIRSSKTYHYDGRAEHSAKEMAAFVSRFPNLTRLVVDLIRRSERTPPSPVNWWQVALASKLESTQLSVCSHKSALGSRDSAFDPRRPG